ncbi:hypothetical protein JG688_00009426 [Phytophthora aleatoria]|uniref:Uncharacterized protein n=1 Tax=Phytophthora aleatoria TaxID=2496075 RepID=A0A8J5M410_9STRA|nr:hypothetical protein JG688_00009426 [Phytophthora aleatoria]
MPLRRHHLDQPIDCEGQEVPQYRRKTSFRPYPQAGVIRCCIGTDESTGYA